MVAFHVGIMGHVRRNSYTSCTRGATGSYTEILPGGVRTAQMVPSMWESWDMSDATRTPPVRGPRELRNFTQPTVQFLVLILILPGDVNSSRGCTNKPFVPDGSLPCGNHGTCQTQLVHLLYEATGSFEISHSPMYSSYGSGM